MRENRGTRRVLVVGATGTVGAHALDALEARGGSARVLVRRANEELAARGVEQMVGDLADGAAVRAALRGVDAALYVSPHDDDETALARTFVDACREEGVRIVFVGVHISGRTLRGRLQRRIMQRLVPHYRGKLDIGRRIERDAPGAVILVPSCFYENDELFLDDIANGTYPAPIKGINRVGAADIGAAAAVALLDPSFPAGTYPICGPATITGTDSAAVWSEALGRPVSYSGTDAVAWAHIAALRLPPGRKGADFLATFGVLGRITMRTDPRDVARTTALLGRPPLDYRTYVRTVLTTAPLATALLTTSPATTTVPAALEVGIA